jgi:hypothetical protein
MEANMAEWAVFWGGLVIFGLLPIGVLGFAYWAGSDVEGQDDLENIGSQDVDIQLKRYKDQ